jgi:hypothetical protein
MQTRKERAKQTALHIKQEISRNDNAKSLQNSLVHFYTNKQNVLTEIIRGSEYGPMAALVNTLMNLRRLLEARYSWMSDFFFQRTAMLHGDCSNWFLVQWGTNFWQTNNPAAGRTELHLGTTNVACTEHVVKGTGRSTPTGSVWKTFQDYQQIAYRTNRINRLQDKHLECRYKNTHTHKTKQVISKVNSNALITSVDHSPALRPIGTGSVQEQSKRELRWTKWRRDRFFSQYFGILLSVSFHLRYTLIVF